jgi:hypothetical protein
MVEWHTVGPYRVSFDVRPDASRFIVLLSWAPGTWLALSERVIASRATSRTRTART